MMALTARSSFYLPSSMDGGRARRAHRSGSEEGEEETKEESRCYRFAWQGFGSEGAIRVASVRRCGKLPAYLIKPVPASSKTDPPLPRAKSVSDGGSAFVIFKKGKEKKTTVVRWQLRERNEMM